MTIARSGLLIANTEVLQFARSIKADKVKSFDNTHSQATQAKLIAYCREHGLINESVYDAAHGRRYLCFVYATREERKACWDYLTNER